MAQNTTNDSENAKYNKKSNIQQIILHEELIYFVKFGIFVFIVFTIFIDFRNIDLITISDFISSLTFILTTTIDSIVLAKSFKVKGNINNILISYIILLILCVIFISLIFVGKIVISSFSICVCDLINIFCCVSPILEMIYDTISHLQNEKNKSY